MKQITAPGGVKLGPYRTVEVQAGHYFVDGGAFVPFTALPAGHAVQDWDGVPPPLPPGLLEERRREKNAEIDRARLGANTATFKHQGKDFAVDALGRGDLDGTAIYVALTNSLPDNWPGVWKATDGTTIPITNVAQFRALYKAMVDQGTSNFTKAETLKAQVAAATTQAQLDAIRW